jgi:glycosyltransferase involved in cell wall biosynthesis/predicted Zn-dependent protease
METMLGTTCFELIPIQSTRALIPPMEPVVTAIISTYNSERFMVACMEDVLAQTIQDKLEILVIDSGSRENEAAIVAKYQLKHKNIRYIRTEREPLYVAWNRAVKLARGKYVVNANTDDSRRPDAFEVLLAAMEKHTDADLAYSYYGMTGKPNDAFPPTGVFRNVRHDPYHPAQLLFYCITGCLQFWRKTALEKIGGFDETLTCVADYEILIRFMRQGLKTILVPEPLSCFYINMQGLSFGSNTAAKEDDAIKHRYRNAVSAAEIYAVDPANPREMAKAWINLGNFAAAVPVPWDDRPHRYFTYAIYCYQQAIRCDQTCEAVWNNLAVISRHIGAGNHFLKTFRNIKPDITQIFARAKNKPTLIGFDLEPKNAGYIYRRENAASAPLPEIAKKPMPQPPSVVKIDAATQTSRISVSWEGSFLDFGSLSHVNRELTRALSDSEILRLQCVNTSASRNNIPAPKALKHLAGTLAKKSPADAQITVRHAWPPDWRRPATGKLVVIQPWEFGALPETWVRQACDVDEFWIPSEYVRRVYVESGVPAEKVFVIPNGVDTEQFRPQASPMTLATQKKFRFLFVGGTIGRKGPDLMLQAYLKNFTAADDVCLVIKDFGGQSVYAGQTFESQIRAAQALPDAPEILYLNAELPPADLPGLYTACQCLVLPYRGEGFGLPALEAMACGLPLIVTAGGATDDFVRDEFAWRIPAERRIFGQEVSGLKLAQPGWLLEPSLPALGEMMREVFADPASARERGQLARRHAEQFCTWKNSARLAAERIHVLGENKNPAPPKTAVQPASVKRPPVAEVGRLDEARELFAQKDFAAAWNATLTAITHRPFHPEALLVLAEIALAAGDGPGAKQCAQRARTFAPGWNPAKQFLKSSLKRNTKPDWLDASCLAPRAPRLTVCLIVKNEEAFLGQCLQSVRDLASQIIVVDTGSTDGTVEIAKEFGAEIHSFAWNDDFAAARNAALEHATGDWILILDADEELPSAQHAQLHADMNQSDVMAYRLPLVNRGQEAEGRSFVPRLFRNAPGNFYAGRIHEQVFSSLLPQCKAWGLKTALGKAEILHHGYTKELLRDRDKIERNLKLLPQAIAENPSDVNLVMNLGLELVRSGDLAGGVTKYRDAFHLMSAQPPGEVVAELREVLLTQFTSQLYKIRAHDEVVCVLNSPLARHGLTASLHFALGLSHFELKDYRAAADQMRQCVAGRRRSALSPINTDILTAAPNHCLALSLARLDELAGAENAFQAALGEAGRLDEVKLDHAKFLLNQNRAVDALNELHEMVTANPGHEAAWKLGGEIALSQPEFLEFARDWTGEAMKHQADDLTINALRAEALMLTDDTAAAVGLWEHVWNREPQRKFLAALILCEVVEAPTTQAPEDAADELATSREFIAWYQKLIASHAQTTIGKINEAADKLSRTLPTAAKILEAALAETETCNTV